MSPSETTNVSQGAYVQVNGLLMYYETYGAGIPVLLLHGGAETCQMWAPFLHLFSTDYQLIMPDSRAHGRTDNPSGIFSNSLMAEDMAELIKTLGLQKPFVVGYSDGARTALNMAMNYPGLTRGYVIGGTYRFMTQEWREMMHGPLGFDGPGIVNFERVLPEFVRDLQVKHDTFHEPGYWKTLLTQLSTQWMMPPDYSPADFANIVEPLLFFCGDRDIFCPPEQNQEMYRMLKQAELGIIPNADHFTIAQQFDVVVAMMQSFMRRVAVIDQK